MGVGCGGYAGGSHEHAHRWRSALLAFSKPPPSPTNLSATNLLWNLKNLICQHVSIICSITVRASGRVRRPMVGEGVGREVMEGGGDMLQGPRQLLSDGKTALWLGPHTGWNCPGQPRNQIINSDTRHSVSWLGLAWKFWYGSISNLSPYSQSPKASLICVYVYVKELRHPSCPVPSCPVILFHDTQTYPQTHTHTWTPPAHPCSVLSGSSIGESHRDLVNQAPTLLTEKKIASRSSVWPLRYICQKITLLKNPVHCWTTLDSTDTQKTLDSPTRWRNCKDLFHYFKWITLISHNLTFRLDLRLVGATVEAFSTKNLDLYS